MRKSRYTVGLTAFVLALSTVLAGCSGGSGNTNETNGQGETTANDKTINLRISTWGIQDGFNAPGAKDDKIYNDLAKRFNVTLEPVQVTWNDWQEKAKVWAASGQLPDIFPNVIAVGNHGMYSAWARQGVIKALPDDLSPYPNLERIMSQPSVQPLKVDGKFYMVPRMTYNDSADWVMDRSILYRKDWAAQAGYTSDPQSFDEFVEMVKAVMAQHPGVVGVAVNSSNYIDTHFLGSFPEMANMKSWVNDNGKWVPSYASSKAYEGINQLRQLYADGLLDKDFVIQKAGDGFTKFLNGQAFVSYGGAINSPAFVETFKKANPDVSMMDAVGIMNIWPAADGNRYTFSELPYWSELFFNNSMDDEKYERALQLVDFMASEEYSALTSNGIEGEDYKIENGKAVSLLTGDQSLQTKYPINNVINVLAQWHGAFYKAGKKVVNTSPELAAWEAYDQETFNKFKQADKPAPLNFDIMLMSTPSKDKLNIDVFADLYKVILGKDDPAKMWQDVVKSYDAKGLQKAIEEVNAQAAELGIQ